MKKNHTLKGFSLLKLLIVMAIGVIGTVVLLGLVIMLFAWVYDQDSDDDDAKFTEEQIITYMENTYGGEFECLELKQPSGADSSQDCKFRDADGIVFYVTLINLTDGTTYTMRSAEDHYAAGVAESNHLLETIRSAGYKVSQEENHGSILVQVSGKDEAVAAGKYLWALLRDEKYARKPIINLSGITASKQGNQGIKPTDFYIKIVDGKKGIRAFNLPVLRDGKVDYSSGYASADEVVELIKKAYE